MKTVYDLKHVRSVTALVLLWNGTPAGKVVANYSDNPNGSVCTANVWVFEGPLAERLTLRTGVAGGCGYDKLSAAVYDCLTLGGLSRDEVLAHGLDSGNGGTETYFRSLGYDIYWVV